MFRFPPTHIHEIVHIRLLLLGSSVSSLQSRLRCSSSLHCLVSSRLGVQCSFYLFGNVCRPPAPSLCVARTVFSEVSPFFLCFSVGSCGARLSVSSRRLFSVSPLSRLPLVVSFFLVRVSVAVVLRHPESVNFLSVQSKVHTTVYTIRCFPISQHSYYTRVTSLSKHYLKQTPLLCPLGVADRGKE